MELLLKRLSSNAECVQGVLYVDGATEAFTLELPLQYDGQENVPNKTCIPPGTYAMDREFSPHLNRMVPKLLDVPERTEIEIHVGNSCDDSLGCILLGNTRISDVMIGESRIAVAAFYEKFDAALSAGEKVTIEIQNPAFVT